MCWEEGGEVLYSQPKEEEKSQAWFMDGLVQYVGASQKYVVTAPQTIGQEWISKTMKKENFPNQWTLKWCAWSLTVLKAKGPNFRI